MSTRLYKQYKTGYEEWDAQRKQNQNIELR